MRHQFTESLTSWHALQQDLAGPEDCWDLSTSVLHSGDPMLDFQRMASIITVYLGRLGQAVHEALQPKMSQRVLTAKLRVSGAVGLHV